MKRRSDKNIILITDNRVTKYILKQIKSVEEICININININLSDYSTRYTEVK